MSGQKLTLINLEGAGAFTFAGGGNGFSFQHFPVSISVSDKSNYDLPDVMGGMKPALFGNNEPQMLRINECWFYKDAGLRESITPDLEQLFLLKKPSRTGSPPRLLLICGDFKRRCLLEEVNAEIERFAPASNNPVCAKVSLSFIVIEQSERVTVTFSEPE